MLLGRGVSEPTLRACEVNVRVRVRVRVRLRVRVSGRGVSEPTLRACDVELEMLDRANPNPNPNPSPNPNQVTVAIDDSEQPFQCRPLVTACRYCRPARVRVMVRVS